MDLQLVKKLAASIDLEESFKHSYLRYHRRGLTYLNLMRSDRLTVKAYFLDPALIVPVHNQWLVYPHNHRYAFETCVLAGSVTNKRFKHSKSGEGWERWDQNWPDIPQIVDRVPIHQTEATCYEPGESYWLQSDAIHTISCSSPTMAVLCLMQYEDELDTTSMYVPPQKTITPAVSCMNERFESVDDLDYYIATLNNALAQV